VPLTREALIDQVAQVVHDADAVRTSDSCRWVTSFELHRESFRNRVRPVVDAVLPLVAAAIEQVPVSVGPDPAMQGYVSGRDAAGRLVRSLLEQPGVLPEAKMAPFDD